MILVTVQGIEFHMVVLHAWLLVVQCHCVRMMCVVVNGILLW